MPDGDEPPATPADAAAARGARVALLVFLLVASAFIVSSAWQIAHGVFFEAPAGPTSAAEPCAG